MKREFKIYRRERRGVTLSLVLSDAVDIEEAKTRPMLAEFFINVLHDQDDQERRAEHLCATLNGGML